MCLLWSPALLPQSLSERLLLCQPSAGPGATGGLRREQGGSARREGGTMAAGGEMQMEGRGKSRVSEPEVTRGSIDPL